MRLFIAIDLPNEIKEHLAVLQKKIKGQEDGVTLTKYFHLTLKFLGEVGETKVPKIKELLSKIRFEPFRLRLNDIGIFPNEGYIRVVWVDAVPQEKVVAVQQAVDEALSNIFPKDERFAVHITLARVKYIKDKKTFLDKVKKINVENLEFDAKEFKLFKSTLTGQGRVYEEIGVFGGKTKAL